MWLWDVDITGNNPAVIQHNNNNNHIIILYEIFASNVLIWELRRIFMINQSNIFIVTMRMHI